jgi:transposase
LTRSGILKRDGKDLVMRKQRTFTAEFKRGVVEELLSGVSRPAQICRRHNISSSLLYRWKKQYGQGRFGNEPTEVAAMQERIEQLERLVGKLTLENEFLKRALQNAIGQTQRRGSSSAVTKSSLGALGGGVS